MTTYFEPAADLHHFTVELVQAAIQECGPNATVQEVALYCEQVVARDAGQHLHREDGGRDGSDGDSHYPDVFCV